jgi:hypothetical protein
MDFVRGIAGSSAPEQAGVFLCFDEEEADWFVRMNGTGGPVDVWAVGGIKASELVESPEGYFFLPTAIPAEQLTLARTDIDPPPEEPDDTPVDGSGMWSGYQSFGEHS